MWPCSSNYYRWCGANKVNTTCKTFVSQWHYLIFLVVVTKTREDKVHATTYPFTCYKTRFIWRTMFPLKCKEFCHGIQGISIPRFLWNKTLSLARRRRRREERSKAIQVVCLLFGIGEELSHDQSNQDRLFVATNRFVSGMAFGMWAFTSDPSFYHLSLHSALNSLLSFCLTL